MSAFGDAEVEAAGRRDDGGGGAVGGDGGGDLRGSCGFDDADEWVLRRVIPCHWNGVFGR